MKSTIKRIVEEHTIKNLLSAQVRIAEKGDAKGTIQIAKYLFRIAEKFDDVIIDIGPERNE